MIFTHLLPEHMTEVCREMDRYRGRHVDFADACLMVLSDSAPKLPVVTLDTADFSVYLRVRTPRMLISPNMG